ncbi:bifunctional 3-demethylubiquinol 3-O-methyltransferase/2-polyprenyl-6-hydroxyphenol methylase [Alkalilimnicola ehrlichii]|uniref:Ubiquinone biosynthesis O-methyltransferase n=1 Tax=Alkalilimnicola ehrlichii TaxID=351052 RepID=A0A3E0WY16_9GAMM|nr:bifunctional 2-polyprenyl-6-hydroxyphenol methylase/3-demethylubiquinol 3-O-methyltransferase UbiG [Alkalilimnicola ehrlichii]RFA27750.1 bifunctional 3-demethylubiquinol 3-O-methyltransferase/2-polyprenyl-6-hydroxyphenol methylase [Alkalilimnicola ehrlichii]RFA36916.1 bifunctional 3-demethylubiquinol 3-O-methyltransferase/2-polyprenyl-6-hydroxyphenol methylase [Alkalilimnicola ehrlichii]
MSSPNVNLAEVEKFDSAASRWWDPEGEFRPLHDINPLRLDYIERRGGLKGRRILDVGCGGGLLAEGMACRGADVLGIDMAPAALEVASLHALETGVDVEYRQQTVETLAEEMPGSFDSVTCLEMLEHVPDPASVIAACARLVKPGGEVFFSTLNRNPKAYLLAIVGAEYLLRLLPKGTHDYAHFIRPSELDAWARSAGLRLEDLTGISYNPLTRHYSLGRDIDVNYLAQFRRLGEEV